MPKLNNLSRQHLTERPVMGDEDRRKEDERVVINGRERMRDRTQAQTALWLRLCLCVPIHWLTALTVSGIWCSSSWVIPDMHVNLQPLWGGNWSSGFTLFSLFSLSLFKNITKIAVKTNTSIKSIRHRSWVLTLETFSLFSLMGMMWMCHDQEANKSLWGHE